MPRSIIAASTIVAVLALSACGGTDTSEEDVHDILTEAGASEEQADCAAGGIADELTQDQLNDLAGADQIDDIDAEIDEKITPILERCLAEGGPVEETETTDTTAEGEGDEGSTDATTTTTAAPAAGATTSTTAAP